MCGILAVLESPAEVGELRSRVVNLARSLRHRGPDWSGIRVQQLQRPGESRLHNVLAHERLGIVDPEGGAQPLVSETGELALTVNGEIYNHQQLAQTLTQPHRFATRSDCEVIVHLYEELGAQCVDRLDGIFAFVLADESSGEFLAARDPIGVVPLYWGRGPDGSVWFASELKALAGVCQRFEPFPPGHLYAGGELRRYYRPAWQDPETIPGGAAAAPSAAELREALERAVVKRMMSDVPYGVLLSGGLDSSLVASIVARHSELRMEDDWRSRAWWPRLHSFCIGLPGAPDLAHARQVADFLGTAHHELNYTIDEGLDALAEVIYHIESYDVTTVRASVPMYLMSRKIKAMGIKMVLSGEGADEVFGGYLYFHHAPDAAQLHAETVRKVQALHHYDCLRANKTTAAWGVEARVPFLDREFLDLAMALDPQLKMVDAGTGRMEKHLLRSAFDTPHRPYLPSQVLWRQKEQFSDGVGYGWIDALRDHAERQVTDELFAAAQYRFPHNTPRTREAYLYRSLFEEHFPQPPAIEGVVAEPSIACSSAVALRWEKEWADRADPSGRAVAAHAAAYDE